MDERRCHRLRHWGLRHRQPRWYSHVPVLHERVSGSGFIRDKFVALMPFPYDHRNTNPLRYSSLLALFEEHRVSAPIRGVRATLTKLHCTRNR